VFAACVCCLCVRDIVPLGKVRSNFNFNLDGKRVLNFENVVTDDDNVKQVRGHTLQAGVGEWVGGWVGACVRAWVGGRVGGPAGGMEPAVIRHTCQVMSLKVRGSRNSMSEDCDRLAQQTCADLPSCMPCW